MISGLQVKVLGQYLQIVIKYDRDLRPRGKQTYCRDETDPVQRVWDWVSLATKSFYPLLTSNCCPPCAFSEFQTIHFGQAISEGSFLPCTGLQNFDLKKHHPKGFVCTFSEISDRVKCIGWYSSAHPPDSPPQTHHSQSASGLLPEGSFAPPDLPIPGRPPASQISSFIQGSD